MTFVNNLTSILSPVDAASLALENTVTPPLADYNTFPDISYITFQTRNYTLKSPALNQVPNGLLDWDFIIEVGNAGVILNFGKLRDHSIEFDIFEVVQTSNLMPIPLKAYFRRSSYSIIGAYYKTQDALNEIPTGSILI